MSRYTQCAAARVSIGLCRRRRCSKRNGSNDRDAHERLTSSNELALFKLSQRIALGQCARQSSRQSRNPEHGHGS